QQPGEPTAGRGPAPGGGAGLRPGPGYPQATRGRLPQPARPAERTGRHLREPGSSPPVERELGRRQATAPGGPATPYGRPDGHPPPPDLSPVLSRPLGRADRGPRGVVGTG